MNSTADQRQPAVERDIRAISLDWEERTGYDSIDTIERIYDRSNSGAYLCVWPRCAFSRKDAVALWRHVHTSHGENMLPPEASSA